MYTRILNRKIHYKKFGSGKPILLVHGWGGNIYSLHRLATIASKQHTVYLIDLPGFGKSDNPAHHWGIEGYALVLREFIQKQKLSKPYFFGHAFGSEIGLYLASHYPQILGKLIFCCSTFRRENRVSKPAQLMKILPRDHWLIRPIYPLVKKLYYRLFHKDSDLLKHPHLEKNFRKIISQDLTSDLQKITNDTLVLWGENDICTPVILGYEMHKKISHSYLHIFPEMGHDFPIQEPHAVWKEIKPFLLN